MDCGFILVPFEDFNPSFRTGFRRARRPRLAQRSQLDRLDDKMFDMELQLDNFENDLKSTLSRCRLGSKKEISDWLDHMSPSVSLECNLEEDDINENTDQKLSGKYTMCVPLCGDVGPDDVTVSLKDHVMTIEAKKEQKSEDGCTRIYQEFSKNITLPPSLDMKEVKSVWNPQGYLRIEAPFRKEALLSKHQREPELEEEPPKKKQAIEIPIHQD